MTVSEGLKQVSCDGPPVELSPVKGESEDSDLLRLCAIVDV